MDFVSRNDNIRAAFLTGSRANPDVKPDCLQDFDVGILVRDKQSLIDDRGWIDFFGETAIIQTPEDSELFEPSLGGKFTFLLQFADKARIDLMLFDRSELEEYLKGERNVLLLADKDNLNLPLKAPSDEPFYVKKPTKGEFSDCRNEFYWVSLYVAKGLWRNEMLYAAKHFYDSVFSMLLLMLSWKAGAENDFKISVGKCCKYLGRYLKKEEYQTLLSFYVKAEKGEMFDSLKKCLDFFEEKSAEVSNLLGFEIADNWHNNVKKQIEEIERNDFSD